MFITMQTQALQTLCGRYILFPFKTFINTCHPKMKFTFEKEQNKCFKFLNFKVIRENNVFTASVYRKPTFSGVYTHFYCYMPLNYKFSLVCTIVFASFTICFDRPKFHQETCKMKDMVTVNSLLTNVLKHSSMKYLFLKEQLKLLKRTKDHFFTLYGNDLD